MNLFDSQLLIFLGPLYCDRDFINASSIEFFFVFSDLWTNNYLTINSEPSVYSKSVISYINQLEDLNNFSHLENVTTIYHYSVPTTKLMYPEPFVAAASFMHSDLWFVHILVYQYWLWFVFVFLIVFFFVTFLCTVRWCNMRVRPRKETRGVSRSKCGDLVTAIVPVSWAASIIINESTDAIDYYDGFGTTEMVVGIRAYQWGWEYYYPKDLDLNYNLKHNYSAFVGHSLKYNTTSSLNLKAENFWKYYQNKNLDSIVTPAHLLVLPVDSSRLLNFFNFNDIGASALNESAAFKKIKMFSKVYTSSLNYQNSLYSDSYKNLASIFTDDSILFDSYLYGLKRSHNFLSSKSLLTSNATFLDTRSTTKLVTSNWAQLSTLDNNKTGGIFENSLTSGISLSTIQIRKIFSSAFPSIFDQKISKYLNYPDLLSLLNNDSDKKKIKNLFSKLFRVRYSKKTLLNSENLNKSNSRNDLIFNDVYDADYKFFSFKTTSLFSSNQAVPLTEHAPRRFANITLSSSNFNLSPLMTSSNSYLEFAKRGLNTSQYQYNNFKNTNWVDPTSLLKLASTHLAFDSPYLPIISKNKHNSLLEYDSVVNTTVEDIPTIFSNKEEFIPLSVVNAYWSTYWSNTSLDWRLKNASHYAANQKSFYLPMFNFYYDYDFRNWQAMSLLEDSFWESTASAYIFDEYASLANEFNEIVYFDRFQHFYKVKEKKFKMEEDFLFQPYSLDSENLGTFYTPAVELENFATRPELLVTSKFFMFPIVNSLLNAEDSYESFKNLNNFFLIGNKITLLMSSPYFLNTPYSAVLDAFRSNYEEFSWVTDSLELNKLTPSLHNNDFALNSTLQFWNNTHILWSNSLFFNNSNLAKVNVLFSFLFEEDSEYFSNSNFFEAVDNSIRVSNMLVLRAPARNSIVNYNAIQKVFHARFDEGRSNINFTDFSKFYEKQPFISASRVPYETLLGKNTESFFKVNLYKPSVLSTSGLFAALESSLNFYFFDFPFLLALKSDASRYLWLDWYAKWGYYEVQPASASRYAIYGMPYFNKAFDFNSSVNDVVNETENYLLRISRARQNYLPNWVYTPYFHLHNANENYTTKIESSFETLQTPYLKSLLFIKESSLFWTQISLASVNNELFFPSFSNTNTFTKSFSKTRNEVQSYYQYTSSLVDIFSRREYLYRELLASHAKLTNLPSNLVSSPHNDLLTELKAAFAFIDPLNYANEYSREAYYSSLEFFNYSVYQFAVDNFLNIFSNNSLSTYFLKSFKGSTSFAVDANKTELLKMQYRPMRKGISNMIRLHATGAIAMPIEIRLQVLASSKDVIHSWAVPSAGIKIDCVPGYSSHRVMIFLVSGIFWGQCMEICGRYHHWMPIVVYFMKRDLFFLWCTHFVFQSGANNMWTINDRQNTNYARVVSYDKATWLTELQATR